MVQQLSTPSVEEDLLYPDSDGEPVAENTKQLDIMITLKGGLNALLEDAFVAADLFWYPVRLTAAQITAGEQPPKQAPDVMVAFGRPKGHRRSYKQWEEENIAPQVVFEIVSNSNTLKELREKKLAFYQKYGVEEYYMFDPERQLLEGWLRVSNRLQPITAMKGWVSPRLNLRFHVEGELLQLYTDNGERLASYAEMVEKSQQAVENARQEKERARQERERAQQEAERADRAEANLAAILAQLQAKGIDVDELNR